MAIELADGALTYSEILEMLSYSGGMGVNVKWFGATGDGVTDDRASIQAAYRWNSAWAVVTSTTEAGAIVINFSSGMYSLGGAADTRVADFIQNCEVVNETNSASIVSGTKASAATGTSITITRGNSAAFVASGSGTTLTVTELVSSTKIQFSGDIADNAVLAGSGIPDGTKIVSQTSGAPGEEGDYETNQATTASSADITQSWGASEQIDIGDIIRVDFPDKGVIWFPPGEYLIGSPGFKLSYNGTESYVLRGSGEATSIVGNFDGYLFDRVITNPTGANRIIDGFSFANSHANGGSIRLNGCVDSVVQNCTFAGGFVGVALDYESYSVKFYNCRFPSLTYGIRGSRITNVTLVGCDFGACTYGVWMSGIGYCQVGCRFETCTEGVRMGSLPNATFTGSGSGTTLTATNVNGLIRLQDTGASFATITGTGVPANTNIIAQLTGDPGGAGTYTTDNATTCSGDTITFTGGTSSLTSVDVSGGSMEACATFMYLNAVASAHFHGIRIQGGSNGPTGDSDYCFRMPGSNGVEFSAISISGLFEQYTFEIGNDWPHRFSHCVFQNTGGSGIWSLPSSTNSIVFENVDGAPAAAANVLPVYARTYANLPANPTEGLMCDVTDATTATWGATVSAGGGANNVKVRFNGTNWTVMGV